MKTKQEKADEAYEEYCKIIDPARKEYGKKLKEIEKEFKNKCELCGK